MKSFFTRRDFAKLCALSTLELRGQGVASRGVKPSPRGKPSGLPFHARFTDIAEAAGLREPVIYGSAGRKPYVLESVGCGAAFFDYDNDGWLDIFVLNGTRVDGAPGATNRLYKNNRDGAFSRRDRQGRPSPYRLGVRGIGRRLQQRRPRGSVPDLLGSKRSLPEQRRRNSHRRDAGSR